MGELSFQSFKFLCCVSFVLEISSIFGFWMTEHLKSGLGNLHTLFLNDTMYATSVLRDFLKRGKGINVENVHLSVSHHC